jgi:hypothetical protein
MSKINIGIIYDTSYLMLPKFAPLKEIIEKQMSFYTKRQQVVKGEDYFAAVEVVPVEVSSEIRRHFDNGEKEQLAKQARKRVARLVEHGAEEPKLPAAAQGVGGGSALSADSDIDRRLIRYAVEKVGSQWQIAVVATDDGGILYDLVKFRKTQTPVFCHTKERWRELIEYFGNMIGLEPQGYAIDSDSGFFMVPAPMEN